MLCELGRGLTVAIARVWSGLHLIQLANPLQHELWTRYCSDDTENGADTPLNRAVTELSRRPGRSRGQAVPRKLRSSPACSPSESDSEHRPRALQVPGALSLEKLLQSHHTTGGTAATGLPKPHGP